MPIPVVVYTLLEYQTLSAAIATGATKVVYGDKTVEYRSLNDMIRIKGMMEAQLFPNDVNNNGRTYAAVSKGTNPGRRRYGRFNYD